MVRRKILDHQTQTTGEPDARSSHREPALALVDDAIMAFASRTLVDGHEIVNCLLDLRNALAAATSSGYLDEGELVAR